MNSLGDIPTIPGEAFARSQTGELFSRFQTGFYSEPADAVLKTLGGE